MQPKIPEEKITLFGPGGFAKEVLCLLIDAWRPSGINYKELACFAESDDRWENKELLGVKVIRESSFEPGNSLAVICIGDASVRSKVASKMPADTRFATLIHPNAKLSAWVTVGEGSIICAGSILTCDISIGRHAHINLNTTIGHDCKAGDFFTTAPGVNISGNCTFGDNVYIGTNAAIKNNIRVCSNVVIGMGAVVVKDITQPGTYIGNPAKKLEKALK